MFRIDQSMIVVLRLQNRIYRTAKFFSVFEGAMGRQRLSSNCFLQSIARKEISDPAFSTRRKLGFGKRMRDAS